jgi:hypothetical protein
MEDLTMRIPSPVADTQCQNAFDDIHRGDYEGFFDKYALLDFNKEYLHKIAGEPNHAKDESLINALIVEVFNENKNAYSRSCINGIIQHLLSNYNLDLTRRDVHGRTPLNNFFDLLIKRLDTYYDNDNIPDLITITSQCSLYCAFLNYCQLRKYNWNQVNHPSYHNQNEEPKSKNAGLLAYFRREETAPKEPTPPTSFENFLATFRFHEGFYNSPAFRLLDEDLQQKLKQQVFFLKKTEKSQYEFRNTLTTSDIDKIEEIKQVVVISNKPSLPAINTNVRESRITANANYLDLTNEPRPHAQRGESIDNYGRPIDTDGLSPVSEVSMSDSDLDLADFTSTSSFEDEEDDIDVNVDVAVKVNARVRSKKKDQTPVAPGTPFELPKPTASKSTQINTAKEAPVTIQTSPRNEESVLIEINQQKQAQQPVAPNTKSSFQKIKEYGNKAKEKIKPYTPKIKEFAKNALIAVLAVAGVYIVVILGRTYLPKLSETAGEYAQKGSAALKEIGSSKFWQEKILKPESLNVYKSK